MPALSALWYFWKFRFLRIYLIAWFLFDKNIDQDFICQMFVTFPELLHVVNLFIRTLWLVITFERSTILLQLSLKVSLPLAAWLWTSCFFPSVGCIIQLVLENRFLQIYIFKMRGVVWTSSARVFVNIGIGKPPTHPNASFPVARLQDWCNWSKVCQQLEKSDFASLILLNWPYKWRFRGQIECKLYRGFLQKIRRNTAAAQDLFNEMYREAIQLQLSILWTSFAEFVQDLIGIHVVSFSCIKRRVSQKLFSQWGSPKR